MLLALRQSSFWTDFSAAANKALALNAPIPVGHLAIFVHASTVDGGVNPNAAGYGGINDSFTDSLGHTWHRDVFSPVDGTDQHTSVEIFTTLVTTQIPASGATIHIVPDSRGLSSNWFIFDLDPQGGGVPTLDKVASAIHTGFSTTMPTGTTATTTDANECVIGAVGVGGASGTFTVAGPWSKLAEYSGSQDGSARAIAVVGQIVSATGAYGVNVTAGSSNSFGCGVIATYKLVSGSTTPVSKTVSASYNIITRVAKTLSASYTIIANPVNTVAPSVTGSPVTGQTLTAHNGTWTNAPTSFTYQWQIETAPGSGVFTDIVGETASTLNL